MTKLLMVDLDGTVRETASGKTFIEEPHDQKIIEGADKALSHYHSKGWVIVGITNQGGVAAGHKSLGAAIEEQRETLEMLPQISAILFCPDFEGNECWWIRPGHPNYAFHKDSNWEHLKGTYRKPKTGMLDMAIALSNYGTIANRPDYWYVGDRPEDSQAAQAAGVNFCDAEVWRSRFLPGLHEYREATPELVEFLEGVKL